MTVESSNTRNVLTSVSSQQCGVGSVKQPKATQECPARMDFIQPNLMAANSSGLSFASALVQEDSGNNIIKRYFSELLGSASQFCEKYNLDALINFIVRNKLQYFFNVDWKQLSDINVSVSNIANNIEEFLGWVQTNTRDNLNYVVVKGSLVEAFMQGGRDLSAVKDVDFYVSLKTRKSKETFLEILKNHIYGKIKKIDKDMDKVRFVGVKSALCVDMVIDVKGERAFDCASDLSFDVVNKTFVIVIDLQSKNAQGVCLFSPKTYVWLKELRLMGVSQKIGDIFKRFSQLQNKYENFGLLNPFFVKQLFSFYKKTGVEYVPGTNQVSVGDYFSTLSRENYFLVHFVRLLYLHECVSVRKGVDVKLSDEYRALLTSEFREAYLGAVQHCLESYYDENVKLERRQKRLSMRLENNNDDWKDLAEDEIESCSNRCKKILENISVLRKRYEHFSDDMVFKSLYAMVYSYSHDDLGELEKKFLCFARTAFDRVIDRFLKKYPLCVLFPSRTEKNIFHAMIEKIHFMNCTVFDIDKLVNNIDMLSSSESGSVGGCMQRVVWELMLFLYKLASCYKSVSYLNLCLKLGVDPDLVAVCTINWALKSSAPDQLMQVLFKCFSMTSEDQTQKFLSNSRILKAIRGCLYRVGIDTTQSALSLFLDVSERAFSNNLFVLSFDLLKIIAALIVHRDGVGIEPKPLLDLFVKLCARQECIKIAQKEYRPFGTYFESLEKYHKNVDIHKYLLEIAQHYKECCCSGVNLDGALSRLERFAAQLPTFKPSKAVKTTVIQMLGNCYVELMQHFVKLGQLDRLKQLLMTRFLKLEDKGFGFREGPLEAKLYDCMNAVFYNDVERFLSVKDSVVGNIVQSFNFHDLAIPQYLRWGAVTLQEVCSCLLQYHDYDYLILQLKKDLQVRDDSSSQKVLDEFLYKHYKQKNNTLKTLEYGLLISAVPEELDACLHQLIRSNSFHVDMLSEILSVDKIKSYLDFYALQLKQKKIACLSKLNLSLLILKKDDVDHLEYENFKYVFDQALTFQDRLWLSIIGLQAKPSCLPFINSCQCLIEEKNQMMETELRSGLREIKILEEQNDLRKIFSHKGVGDHAKLQICLLRYEILTALLIHSNVPKDHSKTITNLLMQVGVRLESFEVDQYNKFFKAFDVAMLENWLRLIASYYKKYKYEALRLCELYGGFLCWDNKKLMRQNFLSLLDKQKNVSQSVFPILEKQASCVNILKEDQSFFVDCMRLFVEGLEALKGKKEKEWQKIPVLMKSVCRFIGKKERDAFYLKLVEYACIPKNNPHALRKQLTYELVQQWNNLNKKIPSKYFPLLFSSYLQSYKSKGVWTSEERRWVVAFVSNLRQSLEGCVVEPFLFEWVNCLKDYLESAVKMGGLTLEARTSLHEQFTDILVQIFIINMSIVLENGYVESDESEDALNPCSDLARELCKLCFLEKQYGEKFPFLKGLMLCNLSKNRSSLIGNFEKLEDFRMKELGEFTDSNVNIQKTRLDEQAMVVLVSSLELARSKGEKSDLALHHILNNYYLHLIGNYIAIIQKLEEVCDERELMGEKILKNVAKWLAVIRPEFPEKVNKHNGKSLVYIGKVIECEIPCSVLMGNVMCVFCRVLQRLISLGYCDKVIPVEFMQSLNRTFAYFLHSTWFGWRASMQQRVEESKDSQDECAIVAKNMIIAFVRYLPLVVGGQDAALNHLNNEAVRSVFELIDSQWFEVARVLEENQALKEELFEVVNMRLKYMLEDQLSFHQDLHKIEAILRERFGSNSEVEG